VASAADWANAQTHGRPGKGEGLHLLNTVAERAAVSGATKRTQKDADKRKAVQTMLADAEWASWSNVAVAKACLVSAGFVRSLRINEVTAPTERTFKTKHGTTATMQTGGIGKKKVESDSTETAKARPTKPPQSRSRPCASWVRF
jgi:hypothetical protein